MDHIVNETKTFYSFFFFSFSKRLVPCGAFKQGGGQRGEK